MRASRLLVLVVAVAALTGCDLGSPSPADPAPSPAATTADPGPTPTTTPSARPVSVVLAPGDQGEQVRELQVRLRQLEWFDGPITGNYRDKTTQAVTDFQSERSLSMTGTVDRPIWSRLVKVTRTPTVAERHNQVPPGPALLEEGDSGAGVRAVQARLKQLNWYAKPVDGAYGPFTTGAVRGFQTKRGLATTGAVDQRTLDRLRGMTRTPTDAELDNRGALSGLDSRCRTGRVLCVSKSTRTLIWMVDGKPQLRMDVRFGRPGMRTREGAFTVYRKSRDHVSQEFGGSMPYAMFFSGGQAVHYSADFARRGYAGASHGCVNVRNLAGIRDLFDQVQLGDKVVIYP